MMIGKKSFMLKLKLILFLGLLLLSCQSTHLNGNNSSMAQITTENQGQILPITAKADINGEMIELEV
ncbi:MAG: hypothetical protein O9972_34720, partial [Burkholderiales bacterium]|nr:hypothetical protein [Burkholderiales bacterium]